MRADQYLVQQGLAASRAQAAQLIESGGVLWRLGASTPWQVLRKNSQNLPQAAQLMLEPPAEQVHEQHTRYVSRAGLKLAGALRDSGVSVHHKLCLDVGQSTGGFTDCLLQHGAAHVVGVDVGHGQLHTRLQTHPQVSYLEKTNARDLTLESLQVLMPPPWQEGAKFDFVTGDLSFISLTLVLPRLSALLAPNAQVLMLVKPQFELQPHQIGKGGVVRDTGLYAVVQERITQACTALGWQVCAWLVSDLLGGDGNREFFIHARCVAPAP